MADFLTVLAERTLSVAPTVQPIIAPMFAPPSAVTEDWAAVDSTLEAESPGSEGRVHPAHANAEAGERLNFLADTLQSRRATSRAARPGDDEAPSLPAPAPIIMDDGEDEDGVDVRRGRAAMNDADNVSSLMPFVQRQEGYPQQGMMPSPLDRATQGPRVRGTMKRPPYTGKFFEGAASEANIPRRGDDGEEWLGGPLWSPAVGPVNSEQAQDPSPLAAPPLAPTELRNQVTPEIEGAQVPTASREQTSLVPPGERRATQEPRVRGTMKRPLHSTPRAPLQEAHHVAVVSTQVAAPTPQSPAAAPTIKVTIGRIEVRAVPAASTALPPAPPAQPKSARPGPKLSLDDYLKQYNGRQR